MISTENGLTGLQLFEEHQPDLVILDWMLPGLDGLQITQRIRAQSDVPIIIITARDAVIDRVSGLETGADDYIVKPFHIDELIARIRARLRRLLPDAKDDALAFEDLSLNPKTYEVYRDRRPLELTSTEFKLLNYLMRHPRLVLSKEQILLEVWGYDFQGDTNIVEQYIRSLRQKLGQPMIIHTIRGAGYVLREAAG